MSGGHFINHQNKYYGSVLSTRLGGGIFFLWVQNIFFLQDIVFQNQAIHFSALFKMIDLRLMSSS